MTGPGAGSEISISLDRVSPEARAGEPVRCGIPFARGFAPAAASIALMTSDQQPVSLQTEILDRWSDGSTRWLLLDFAVPDDSAESLRLGVLPNAAGPEDAPLASTAGARVHLRAGNEHWISPGSRGLLVRPSDGFETAVLRVHGTDGAICEPAWRSCAIETSGPVRSTVVCRGDVDVIDRQLSVTARLTAFASTPAIRIDITLHNPSASQHPGNFWELGDPGSILLRGVTLWLAEVGQAVTASLDLNDPPHPVQLPFRVHQESSGGEHWNSPVHRVSDGTVPLRHKGFTVRDGAAAGEGLRADPLVTVSSATTTVSAYLHEFCQKFPSSISADPESGLVVSLYPVDASAPLELQGGERTTRTVTFCCGRDRVCDGDLGWAREPTLAHAAPSHYCSTGVLPFLVEHTDPRHDVILQEALDGPVSFGSKREAIDEYGWRHFGDLYADHEAVNLQGTTPLVSHYNNQYDAMAGLARQFMRTGDRQWWDWFDQLARHVANVDIYDATGDKAAYRGGLFWHTFHYKDAGLSTHRSYPRTAGVHGGGPSAEHNYNLGLALHYWLTGSHASRAAAIGLADWVIRMDDGRQTVFRWLDRGSTGWASSTGALEYQGPGRGAGNSIAALLVGAQLSGERGYRDKAEELIRRCVHATDDQHRLDLLNPEPRWSYTVFLQVLGRYLIDKAERREIDPMYTYGRDCLLAYARWMEQHERPYLTRPELLEYPTETWPAQDLRKAEVFVLARLVAEAGEREQFAERALFFFDAALNTLGGMATRTLTRPVVILLSYAGSVPWITAHPDDALPPATCSAAVGRQRMFVPQRVRALRRARIAAAIGGAALVAGVLLLIAL